MSTPYLPLCTENLTPFLSLLPSKGLSGLSTLLAQPNIVLAWGFKTEGIAVVMPSPGIPGRWRGWWEGVVDLVPEKGGSRAFSLGSLFKKGIPRPFPESSSSVLRLIKAGGEVLSIPPDSEDLVWIDGREREVEEWDLLDERVQHKDIRVTWVDEDVFHYRKSLLDQISQCLTL
jgi:phosphatidylinositol glycan class T